MFLFLLLLRIFDDADQLFIGIESRPEGLVISTTDTHLPRRIGDALKHAYHGEMDLHYDQDEEFVRVTWTR